MKKSMEEYITTGADKIVNLSNALSLMMGGVETTKMDLVCMRDAIREVSNAIGYEAGKIFYTVDGHGLDSEVA